MKKRFLCLIITSTVFFVHNSFAQDTIFKCVDNDGNVSYLNSTSGKGNCTKTNLANVDSFSIVSMSSAKNKNHNTSSTSNTSSPNISNNNSENKNSLIVKDEEQQLRETKRELVLKKELNDEKEQLDTVKQMLAKASSTDATQLSQLNEMQQAHQRNITALEKELGINKKNPDITLSVVDTKTTKNSDKISDIKQTENMSSKKNNKLLTSLAPNDNIKKTDIKQNLVSNLSANKFPIVVKKEIVNNNKASMFAPVPKFIPPAVPKANTKKVNDIDPQNFLLGNK